MQLKNSQRHYGLIAIAFHWVMAVMIIGLIVFGIYMVPLSVSTWKLKLYRWHKEYGMLILMLVFVRITWRLTNKVPVLLLALPQWQKLVARSVHYLFYLLMIVLPVTGWVMSSATGFPVSFFGLFLLPDLVTANESLREVYVWLHQWLGYFMAVLICLHVAATVQHYFVYRDNILRKMWL